MPITWLEILEALWGPIATIWFVAGTLISFLMNLRHKNIWRSIFWFTINAGIIAFVGAVFYYLTAAQEPLLLAYARVVVSGFIGAILLFSAYLIYRIEL